jgi:hypothetical protein
MIDVAATDEYVRFVMPYLVSRGKTDPVELRRFAKEIRASRDNRKGELLRGTTVDGYTYWWPAYDLTHERFSRLFGLPESGLDRNDLAIKVVPR